MYSQMFQVSGQYVNMYANRRSDGDNLHLHKHLIIKIINILATNFIIQCKINITVFVYYYYLL
jgi:uncharacterized sporulation protein YeaH/YhbH (DUF444 family)